MGGELVRECVGWSTSCWRIRDLGRRIVNVCCNFRSTGISVYVNQNISIVTVSGRCYIDLACLALIGQFEFKDYINWSSRSIALASTRHTVIFCQSLLLMMQGRKYYNLTYVLYFFMSPSPAVLLECPSR